MRPASRVHDLYGRHIKYNARRPHDDNMPEILVRLFHTEQQGAMLFDAAGAALGREILEIFFNRRQSKPVLPECFTERDAQPPPWDWARRTS